jgi:hypothetical protein
VIVLGEREKNAIDVIKRLTAQAVAKKSMTASVSCEVAMVFSTGDDRQIIKQCPQTRTFRWRTSDSVQASTAGPHVLL